MMPPFPRIILAPGPLPDQPATSTGRPERDKLLAHRSTVGSLVSLFLVSAFLVLSFWVAVPAVVLGWNPTLITSGSMAPAFRSGDIVLIDPNDGEGLGAGTVISYEDPAGAGRVSHRIYQVLPDGRYVTKGDANAFADSTPLEAELVEGVGRLLVPFVGLPLVWAEQGAWLNLGASALVLALLLWLLRSPPAEQPAREPLAMSRPFRQSFGRGHPPRSKGAGPSDREAR